MSDEVERWKSLDAASYDDVAEQFDVHSNRLSSAAARRLLDLARVAAGDHVLDVGTGAGLLPFEIVRSRMPVQSVVGIDISRGMVAAARKKADLAAIAPSLLRFEEMDAEHLAFGDAEFDLALSAFALTHVPHPDVALAEIYRVLRPGGRVAIALGSRPPLLSFDGLAHAVREVKRRIERSAGRRLTSDLLDRTIIDAYGPTPADLPRGSRLSVQLNRAALLAALVSGAGFTNVQRSWRNYQNEVVTADEFWDIHRTIRSDARKRLLDSPDAMVGDVRRRFMEQCRRTLERGGVLTFPISAVFVVAEKPA